MTITASALGTQLTSRLASICPTAPSGAQKYVDEVTSYVMWGVLAIFFIAALIGIGAIIAGRIFGIPMASKAGAISLVVIFMGAILYMIFPGMVEGITGSGCL